MDKKQDTVSSILVLAAIAAVLIWGLLQLVAMKDFREECAKGSEKACVECAPYEPMCAQTLNTLRLTNAIKDDR